MVKHVGVVCLVCLLALVFAQVLLRYGFGYSHFLTEEFGRYFLVWVTLAGAAIEVRRQGHIRVSFFSDRLSNTIRKVWLLLLDLLTLTLLIVLVVTGIGSTIFNHGQDSPGMQIPLSVPFFGVPLFFLIAALFVAEIIWQRWRAKA